MEQVIASHFLAGAILTWAIPIGLLVVIGIYWAIVFRRQGFDKEL
jgi:cytochrome c-type biogenesis protein CcmH/NrfF